MRHFITLAAILIALAAPAQKQRFMYDGEKKIYYTSVADAENTQNDKPTENGDMPKIYGQEAEKKP